MISNELHKQPRMYIQTKFLQSLTQHNLKTKIQKFLKNYRDILFLYTKIPYFENKKKYNPKKKVDNDDV